MFIQEVQEFCYLGDMLDTDAGAERAVKTRVACAWSKWRELASILTNKSIPLKSRARVYEMCVRSVLIYGSEAWPLTQSLTELLRTTDRRMMRYMANIRLKDKIPNKEVARRCGLPDLESRLRQRRLRWFGHVKRAEADIIGEVSTLPVAGRRPPGRPQKTWHDCIKEDLRALHIKEDAAYDRKRWKMVISTSNPR